MKPLQALGLAALFVCLFLLQVILSSETGDVLAAANAFSFRTLNFVFAAGSAWAVLRLFDMAVQVLDKHTNDSRFQKFLKGATDAKAYLPLSLYYAGRLLAVFSLAGIIYTG